MTKLLISLPLSDRAQKYYGSNASTYNKVGDAGIDLPFIGDWQPYDVEVTETIGLISFGTIFAMYTISSQEAFDYFYLTDNKSTEIIQYFLNKGDLLSSHFDIRPRSSIGKSPFRLANSVGTIDKTYCGIESSTIPSSFLNCMGDTLGAYLDYHPQLGTKPRKSSIAAGERLLQIVAPSLDDIVHVRLDFTEENCVFWSETISSKKRDGFGSSGR